MSTPMSSQPHNSSESLGYELTAMNAAIRGMYSQEVSKIAFGIQGAKPSVQEVMKSAMSRLYATGIQHNQKQLGVAANDEDNFPQSA